MAIYKCVALKAKHWMRRKLSASREIDNGSRLMRRGGEQNKGDKRKRNRKEIVKGLSGNGFSEELL